MNGFLIWLIFIIVCISIGVIADVTGITAIDVGVANNYHSCTKAYDIRCDYYIEYDGDNLINVTRTDNCIFLSNFTGC
jgi:hypothetical protein